MPHINDLPTALRHARASLELRPFDPEYERTLEELLERERMQTPRAPEVAGGSSSGARGADIDGGGALSGNECGAGPDWHAGEPPAGGVLPACTKPRGYLLVNPFEEGCFHDDLRSKQRQNYHSCGQYNNVLASLLHALALSRMLCRTLVLPGFFVRFGSRLTRVSAFEEVWLPTGHFLNLTTLRSAFSVVEMDEWKRNLARSTAAKAARVVRLPKLLARAVEGRPPQLRFFEFHGIEFDVPEPALFPHFMQQQSELRWVTDDASRRGYFSRFDASYAPRFWQDFARSKLAGPQVKTVAFDAAPAVGFFMDHLRSDDSLRFTRGHVRYNGPVHAEAQNFRRALFGDAPYLAVHIRRGADRLHDFCHTDWGQKCYGWNITMAMCYPSTEMVAEQILSAQRRWAIDHVFLATDSPSRELFEDVLREHGVRFARYGQQGPPPSLGDEFALPVDQMLCASAPYFLGNVPSTVTATIVQERDSIGWSRETSDFFGFGDTELGQFRRNWAPTDAFREHYYSPGGCVGGA